MILKIWVVRESQYICRRSMVILGYEKGMWMLCILISGNSLKFYIISHWIEIRRGSQGQSALVRFFLQGGRTLENPDRPGKAGGPLNFFGTVFLKGPVRLLVPPFSCRAGRTRKATNPDPATYWPEKADTPRKLFVTVKSNGRKFCKSLWFSVYNWESWIKVNLGVTVEKRIWVSCYPNKRVCTMHVITLFNLFQVG